MAAVPFAVALAGGVLSLGMATGAAVRPTAELDEAVVARFINHSLDRQGFQRIMAAMTPGQLAIARRFDPMAAPQTGYGLTPGWENLSLGGKPRLDSLVAGLKAQQLNAAAPIEANALQVVQSFDLRPASDQDHARAVRCLTQAIYYEAALEPGEGQAAVAQVVLNRVRDPNFPNTVCGVVYQGAERLTGCQFSFVCDGSLSRQPTRWAWRRAEQAALRALSGGVAHGVGTATHYHADYVRPWWAPSLAKITQIGAHIFYRWKGKAGETSAFSQVSAGREPVINEALYAQPRRELAVLDDAGLSLQQGAEGDKVLTPGQRRVEYEGTTRIVGAPSLGGRRQASKAEIAVINERLKAFEAGKEDGTPPALSTSPPGVTPMEVEEVGKPSAKGLP